jgi:predicted ferric reductase
VAVVIGLNALVILGMWVRHGGLDLLGTPAADLTALGQLTALLGTYVALVQIVLMSRSPWLDQLFGMDRLARWHRVLGFTCVNLICAHVVLTTVGYALGTGASIAAESWRLLTTFPYVLMATVGTGLLIMVAVASVRRARARLQYETWHFIHLYAYLAIALSFGHVLAVGTDFSNDGIARAYWIALYMAVAALVLMFRFGQPARLTLRHRLRVHSVVAEAPGVASVYVTGRNLQLLSARAGQYLNWRFLAPGSWWQAHPFSLSAAPNGAYLRLTVKNVGEGTAAIHHLRPGTRVAIEGPYGTFTTVRRRQQRVLLVAGGIGITPIRSLLEELHSSKGAIVVLYRARSWDEVIFQDELDRLVQERRGTLHYLVGRRGAEGLGGDPLSASALRRLVPDIQQRDVFICGSAEMMHGLHESLGKLQVPSDQVHYERFALL